MSESRCFLSTSSSKFKHSVVKARTELTKHDKNKSKTIAKQRVLRCPQNCNKHLFSIMKSNDSDLHSTFRIQKYGIFHSFCPTYNELIGGYEGGIPEFNGDGNIETPTFLSKCEKSNPQTVSHKLYQQRFRENLAKATNSTAEDYQNVRIGENPPKTFKKIKDQSLNEVLNFYKLILETKQKRQQQNHQKLIQE